MDMFNTTSLSDRCGLSLAGHLHLEVRRRGEVVEVWDDHNLITNAARPRIRDIMSGEMTNAHITTLGVGEGQIAQPSDTGIVSGVMIPISSVSKPSLLIARFHFLVGPDKANGLAVREFGLFCGDGTLFAKRVRERVIEKDPDVSIFGYWDINF